LGERVGGGYLDCGVIALYLGTLAEVGDMYQQYMCIIKYSYIKKNYIKPSKRVPLATCVGAASESLKKAATLILKSTRNFNMRLANNIRDKINKYK
jgi:hypothetical protein